MCGRYSIYESMDHYLKELAPRQRVINGYDLWPTERYNVEAHWSDLPPGERNVVRRNCIHGGARDGDNHGL